MIQRAKSVEIGEGADLVNVLNAAGLPPQMTNPVVEIILYTGASEQDRRRIDGDPHISAVRENEFSAARNQRVERRAPHQLFKTRHLRSLNADVVQPVRKPAFTESGVVDKH